MEGYVCLVGEDTVGADVEDGGGGVGVADVEVGVGGVVDAEGAALVEVAYFGCGGLLLAVLGKC